MVRLLCTLFIRPALRPHWRGLDVMTMYLGTYLGKTVDGRDLDMLQVGTASEGKRALWIIGRQHPGESMAEWWMEGFLDRLLDETDPLADSFYRRPSATWFPI